MRYILILTLFFGFLQAKSPDACYSVQLKSFYLKRHSSYNFERQNYPDSCILVKIHGLYTVRCGCYDDYREAEDKLDRLSRRYYDAIIVTTYKRRFDNQSYEDAYHSDRSDREDEYSLTRRDPRTKYSGFEDDFNAKTDLEEEKSFYEETPKKRRRNFYGAEDYADNIIDDEPQKKTIRKKVRKKVREYDFEPRTPKREMKKREQYFEDDDDGSHRYHKKDERDYARTSGRW